MLGSPEARAKVQVEGGASGGGHRRDEENQQGAEVESKDKDWDKEPEDLANVRRRYTRKVPQRAEEDEIATLETQDITRLEHQCAYHRKKGRLYGSPGTQRVREKEMRKMKDMKAQGWDFQGGPCDESADKPAAGWER